MTFLKTNIITLFSKLVCLASAFFISVYIARFLGPSAKGTYYLLVQVVSMLATVSLFGVDTSAIYHLGKGYSPRRVVTIANIIIIAISASIAAFLFFGRHMPLAASAISKTDPAYLALIALALPFMAIVRMNSAVMMGFNRYLAYNLLNITLFVVMAAGFILFVVVRGLGLTGALVGFGTAYAAMSFIYIIMILNSPPMRGGDKKPIETAKLVSYGGRVFLVPVILLGIYRVDSFFLGYCTGASAVGFYSVALSFAELLLLIPESVGTILFPNLAYTAKSDVDKKFVFILKTSFLITAVATAVFFASIGYVLPLVYSSVYLESVGLVNILLPGMVAMSFYYLFSSYFQAVGRPGFVTVVLAAVFAEKLFLSWLLIPPMGAVGAAIASTIAYVTCFAAFLLAFRVKAKYGVSEIFALSRSELDYIRNSLNNIFDFQK